MEINFIGTQSIAGRCTSYIINHHILFDCGFGTVRTIRDTNLDEAIDTIIISHLHPDHVADIIYFIITCFAKKRPSKDLQIIGPTGTKDFIKNLNLATFSGDLNDNLDEYFDYFNTVLRNLVELADGQSFANKKLAVHAFRVIHGASNSNAYIVKLGSKVLGCTGDTSFCHALANNIHCAPVWIIDTTHNKEIGHTKHLSLEKLEQLAKEYPVLKFYAIHGSNYRKETTCPNIFFPNDGSSITI